MKKLIVILSIFISFSNIIFSQDLQINWQQCFGGSKTDIARDIILSGNCFLTVGYTGSNDGDVSYNHGDNDVWLIKTDSIGALIWEKSYGGS
ncbi:MAG: hypothetical protein KAV44_09075, partial [Bacteroidales bacterium]|nr:hypothetical protein [Bacteroidales bacterium]